VCTRATLPFTATLVESEAFEGFEEQGIQEFEKQQSFVEGKSPLMHTRLIPYNMHLIHHIYFIACINFDAFLLRIMTSVLFSIAL
jgi:hypothetical protein